MKGGNFDNIKDIYSNDKEIDQEPTVNYNEYMLNVKEVISQE